LRTGNCGLAADSPLAAPPGQASGRPAASIDAASDCGRRDCRRPWKAGDMVSRRLDRRAPYW